MSKLYNTYENLKNNNNEKIYLFECGNFYIALDSDAILLNELFSFKLTKFSNICDKCGFPKNALEKYKKIFDENKVNYEIIKNKEKNSDIKLKEIISILNMHEVDKLGEIDCKQMILNIKNIILS